jgi:hypothetical protein
MIHLCVNAEKQRSHKMKTPNFFVNQFIQDGYMHFLHQLDVRYSWSIHIFDIVGVIDNSVSVLRIPTSITPKILRIPIQSGQEYHYEVHCNGLVDCTGYFSDTGDTFGFLSCNDNPAVGKLSWNKYHASGGTWKPTLQYQNQVTVHLGDNVYMDSVWHDFRDENIDLTTVVERATQLYVLSFADRDQGQYMRQGIQLHMIDDHDFMDGASKTLNSNKYLKYVCAIRTVHQLFIASPVLYLHGPYMFHLCRTRDAMMLSGIKFPPTLIEQTRCDIQQIRNNTHHIICIQQPLVHLGQ